MAGKWFSSGVATSHSKCGGCSPVLSSYCEAQLMCMTIGWLIGEFVGVCTIFLKRRKILGERG